MSVIKMRFIFKIFLLITLSGFLLGEETTLHLWHPMPAPSRAVLNELVAEYESLNPGIKVHLLYKENEEVRMAYMSATGFTEGGPDLLYGPSDFTGALVEMDIIKPLEDLFTAEELAAFDPKGLTWYNDHLYQIGDELGNHLALVYNKRLFAEVGLDRPPNSLQEMVEFGKLLTKDKDGDGIIDQYGLVWNFTEPFFFMPFYASYGGWVMDEDQNPTLNNQAAVKAFEFVRDMRDKHKIIPRECDYDVADSKFNSGTAAMLINGAWAWAKYMESPHVDFGLAVLPVNEETGLFPAPMVATKGYFLNPYLDGERLDQVLDLVKFLTGPEAQYEYASRLATIPTLLAVREHPDIANDPIIRTSIEQVQRGKAMPISPQMRAIWDAMRPAYQNVLGGSMTPVEGAKYQQDLAVQKVAELFEGADIDQDAVNYTAYLVYLAGILLVVWAVYKLIKAFIFPLIKGVPGVQVQESRFGVLMVAPAALFIFGVVVYPFFYNLVISFSNMGLTTVNDWEIIGLAQYGKVMTDVQFYNFFLKTVIWTVVNVTLHVFFGVMLALLLNRPLPGKGIIRVLLILPWAVPSYITALTWRGMFNIDYGAVNVILKNLFGLEPISWLIDPTNAFIAVIITNVWLGIPFMMIIALGGLQSIPQELYEAASIDGASAWQQFKNITLPLLKPVMIPAVTLGIVWTFNNINVVWLVSNGGQPGDQTHILVSFVYRAAFNLYRYGYAAAFSVLIFLMLAFFSVKFMQRSKVTKAAY
ncbi:MAG: extracellular solute-binding protein [Candidatus Marinimicrobia bacterium]|nr:extracellular solute-binding protein [Candidatus Neomarinimicrobiota bacterium]MCF7851056.1 extracellular solute-binding protein [Candidatus Neomarinimicrobiota bacterium]MCF7904026.1 extracellular solute-binding protein [Candidatus Neomarinimicrobiota bacterium]